MSTKPKRCRWGILGTANIARKNWQAIRNASNATLTAVASRDVRRAEEFIGECQAQVAFDPRPRALGSYEELLASDEVDAVYIPLPTGVRREWVIRAAQAGKHVLCEKPCGMNVGEVEEILRVCRENSLQFMDGVMFMHSGRMDRLRETLRDGQSIGEIKRIVSQFSFLGTEDFLSKDIRLHSGLEPLGCLGDLGWYTLRIILWAMNWEMPRRVTGRMLSQLGRGDSPETVPMEFSGELFFNKGESASFYCSFLTELQQWIQVSGTRGSLYIPDFVLPYFGNEVAFFVSNPVFDSRGCDSNMENHTRRVAVSEYSNSAENAQETNMISSFSRLVLTGKPNPVWGEYSLKTQRVLDACLASARAGERW